MLISVLRQMIFLTDKLKSEISLLCGFPMVFPVLHFFYTNQSKFGQAEWYFLDILMGIVMRAHVLFQTD